MPLDMDALYRQVEEMVDSVPLAASRRQLLEAQEYLRRADPDVLRRKLEEREGKPKIPWLVAEPVDTLACTTVAPAAPDDYTIVAADGSSIPPDRHSPVRYFVLNMGSAVLTYGQQPDARLDAYDELCHDEDNLYFDPGDKRIPIEGRRLGIRMSVDEAKALVDAASRCRFPWPVVAIRDGSLILWQLQSKDEDQAFCSHYLNVFLGVMGAFRDQGIPVCSYISYPGSSEVANSLRLLLCDRGSRSCPECPQDTDEQQLCRFIGTVLDRHLYQGLLQPGERSDILKSQSQILERYGAHRVQFFYLNVGGEIARIEAPQWLMQDQAMLDLVHGIVVDQCLRSAQYPPYPPVLIEAHEQAVISTAERQVVDHMVERALAAKGHWYERSAKDRSKRNRGV